MATYIVTDNVKVAAMATSANFIPAFDVETATGLTNDLLRKWRERYGFPLLQHDAEGRKGYSAEQIEQLRAIRQLLNSGFTPRQLVGRSLAELSKLTAAIPAFNHQDQIELSQEMVRLLRAHDLRGLKKALKHQRAKSTPTDFAAWVVAPLVIELGDAWARGDIKVYHEHICTSILTHMLIEGLLAIRPKQNFPRVLFATPPNELHVLGLMMAQVALADAGADCLSLGPNTPVSEIVPAAKALECDIVAISMSFAYPKHRVLPFLRELSSQLPSWVEIWVGGAGAQDVSTSFDARIHVFNDLASSVSALLARVR